MAATSAVPAPVETAQEVCASALAECQCPLATRPGTCRRSHPSPHHFRDRQARHRRRACLGSHLQTAFDFERGRQTPTTCARTSPRARLGTSVQSPAGFCGGPLPRPEEMIAYRPASRRGNADPASDGNSAEGFGCHTPSATMSSPARKVRHPSAGGSPKHSIAWADSAPLASLADPRASSRWSR